MHVAAKGHFSCFLRILNMSLRYSGQYIQSEDMIYVVKTSYAYMFSIKVNSFGSLMQSICIQIDKRYFLTEKSSSCNWNIEKQSCNKDFAFWSRKISLYMFWLRLNLYMNHALPLTLYVAVTQFTYGKLRHCYVKS